MNNLMSLLQNAGFAVREIPTRSKLLLKLTGLIINENLRLIYEEEEDGTLMIRQIIVEEGYTNLGYTTRILEFLSKQNTYNVILPFVTTPKLAHICDKLGIKRDDSCVNKYGYNSAFYAIAREYAFYEGEYGHYVVKRLEQGLNKDETSEKAKGEIRSKR
ncbi:hypothetical protein CS063_15125 [Sporanaerobium hydrogeniformans]|uniref:Uncharacterized protein n=1 Tax=Sporanaerobium hydrogeniformans TaxID=3072179 RepID=A0AC61D7P4_9FIRM|nr:hypothetical protein [Sporanaerobium hydrogeniformans]PHV69574.1 hypothetical protein CS063_15125 [Sporanaerobium hydrogeniformans]